MCGKTQIDMVNIIADRVFFLLYFFLSFTSQSEYGYYTCYILQKMFCCFAHLLWLTVNSNPYAQRHRNK